MASRTRPLPARILFRAGVFLLCAFAAYLLIAYVTLPFAWTLYEIRHPALEDAAAVTQTGDRHPGDPINIALIGAEDDLVKAMLAAGWRRADPLGLASDAEIAVDSILERPYEQAPVSHLYYWGHKEDLAFERPVGGSPRERRHVRFWKSAKLDLAGRPLWAGAVTFDKSVGFSHTTGQITHHIDGDVDEERDRLVAELQQANAIAAARFVNGFHARLKGKNGGGDPWRTDGRLAMAELIAPAAPVAADSRISKP